MHKHKEMIIILFLLLIAASCPASGKSKIDDYKFHTPAEFINIMRNGEIAYTFTIKQNPQPTNLVVTNPEPYLISPYLRIMYDKSGNAELVDDQPEGEVKKIYELAAQKLKQKDYDAVLKLYEQAMEINSNYFKTWTNMGDTYFWLGNYDKAEKYLLKAIELNEVGYQEHYFLAEVYNKTGKNQKALEQITYAYMLNKQNPNVKTALSLILKNNGLKPREDRLKFPFEIKKKSKTECEIIFQEKDGLNWMPMANCLACWQMEPSFQKLLNDEQNVIAVKTIMYKECIANQVATVASKKQEGKDVSAKELELYEMVNGNYLDAILYWEIVGGEAPQIVLLIPKEGQDRIVQYIKRYVFEKK